MLLLLFEVMVLMMVELWWCWGVGVGGNGDDGVVVEMVMGLEEEGDGVE